MSEHRRAQRTRTFLGARAVFNSGLSSVECQVRDLSETGAKLIVDEPSYLPEEFQLEVPRRGLSCKAKVRWRSSDAVGIQFVDQPATADEPDPLSRIQQLEAENAVLRRRVADMAKRLDSYGDSERHSL